MIDGTLTGSGSGSQSYPHQYIGYVFAPSPLDWVTNAGTYAYTWKDDDPTMAAANATSHLYYPNSDDPPYVTSNGTSTVHFTLYTRYVWSANWDDADTGVPPNLATKPTPPASEQFLLQTQLRATAFEGYTGNGYGSTTASDYKGLSASASLQDDVFNETVTAVSPAVPNPLYGQYVTQYAGGKHIVTAGLQMINGKAVYTISLTGNSTGSAVAAIGNQGIDGSTNSSTAINGYVTPDERAVTISCPTIETSYSKGPVDSLHPTGKWPHSLPTMQGDAAATYSNADSNRAWVSNATFSANTPGFTNPSYAWSSDFNDAKMLGVDLTQSSVAGSWLLYGADKLPVTKTIKLNVQDGPGTDRATAANTYAMNWHLPYEVNSTSPFEAYCGKYTLSPARLGPVHDGQTDLLQPTPSQKIDWGAAIDGSALVATAAGQEEIAGGLEILGAVAKTAKWETDLDPEPQTSVGGTNGPITWGDAMNDNKEKYGGSNVPAGLVNDPDGWQLCNMYIYQCVHYTDESWCADGYNIHGYDGNPKHILFVHSIDSVFDEFQFLQYKTRDGSPVP